MAHYAVINENNIVIEVITGRNEDEAVQGIYDWEAHYSEIKGMTCLRTSYNTHGNQHTLGGTPFRKNYAGPGFVYDKERDAFIPPKTFNSWILNEETCLWEAPVEYPGDGGRYDWNEENQSWEEITE